MPSKAETAALLRGLGYSYLEIARELYPGDYRRYRETGDRRLYQLLKKRVWKLLRLAGGGGSRGNGVVDPPAGWTLEVEFDESGWERDSPTPRAPPELPHPRERKRGLRGFERQVVEYEQLLYYYYTRHLKGYDSSGVIWGTIKLVHGRAFRGFYEEHGVNVWRREKAGRVARAYVYSVMVVSLWLHGYWFYSELRERLRRALDVDREDVAKVLPLVMGTVV
ncbi:hypothetical protein ASQ66_gp14 [Aeropyrum pernix spindle-shaped virus 1]|uniref:Uncharacterized protein n=1 Tax=Aeropyrum pernix (strain ATCC 700893 / DSM 11879 / JCM 9820 / NBRC 100138 / K1) TaxID=272557 RepID=Q9YDT1_AERPE|nr:hypothetical protein [Aeropyrum pernix]YP_009177744.1 hypothetical protein ASQ66_gp14 [Aeropyrum pernix spindle-shaped virus 1]BAA79816.1 hypothetical protein APE_0836 [Aeropyrum pernix spindle-shaped virus 1] [Aeropyrum pernix K1]CCD22102.1 TPA: hypothetical protein [Aeropyrum pernix spindle-shaped virus 1]